jgi:uncharacterized protein
MRIGRGALALTLCAAVEVNGCGGPRGPVQPATRIARTQRYQPLGMKADAALAGQAVILGTDEADGSTVLPIPAAPSTVVVDAMVVTHGAGPASGGSITGTLAVTLAVTLTTAPAAPDVPRPHAPATPAPDAPRPHAPTTPAATAPATRDARQVGVVDPAASAPWRQALSSAAFIAATALGKDVSAFTFSAVPASPGDGPAASALLAGGFLAAMTGATIDPAATLTGTIDPDGTIGPAPGIPEQLLAAIAHGKTRLGFPAGMRLARSLATGAEVDLVQLARDHHAEAVELADVYDAYQLLTRKPLPIPVPVTEADMALDPDTRKALDATFVAWRTRLAGEWAPLLELTQAGRLPATVARMVRVAEDRGAQAEALYRAGQLPAAYGRVLMAWVYAAGANQTYAVLAKLSAGDVDGALATLAALDLAGAETAAIFTRLGALRPATLEGHLGLLAALQAALRGASTRGFAADSIRAATQLLASWKDKPAAELGTPATVEAAGNAVAPAVVLLLRTAAETAIAEQALALTHDRGVPYAGSPPDLAGLVGAFGAGATASLRYADTLLVEPRARGAGIPLDLARRRLAAAEPDYLLADALSRAPDGGLPRELGAPLAEGSVGESLRLLAGHVVAYGSAALLVAKYASLAVHVDDTGKLDGVEHAEALRSLLANARRSARASARAARIATGAIPVQARLAYQLATVEETGSIDDQLEALAELWSASTSCQVAVMLARH